MCICHRAGVAFCVKATSQVQSYLNNPGRMSGAVFIPAGTVDFFPKDTVIQPDNQIPIPHSQIDTQRLTGEFRVEGALPSGFRDDFVRAVKASVTMTPREQKRLLAILEDD